MDFQKMLERYMLAVIDDDPVVARRCIRDAELDAAETAYLETLYRELSKVSRQP